MEYNMEFAGILVKKQITSAKAVSTGSRKVWSTKNPAFSSGSDLLA